MNRYYLVFSRKREGISDLSHHLQLFQQELAERIAVNGAPHHFHVPDILAQDLPPRMEVESIGPRERRAPHGRTALVEELGRHCVRDKRKDAKPEASTESKAVQ